MGWLRVDTSESVKLLNATLRVLVFFSMFLRLFPRIIILERWQSYRYNISLGLVTSTIRSAGYPEKKSQPVVT